ncbi:sulfotransferase [Thiorhodococcus fuscus]|uniref:Sulfotransferase n=1 Tax=Thiorhodococcus fuscus TaxID=527200 RepID=A0ABW4YE58_9GAMM
MSRRTGDSAADFVAAIDSALGLLQDYADQSGPSDAKALAQPLPSLLEQCQTLLAEAEVQEPPPVRTLHHLACTGGTLISRCIAAQPNTQVLSEVDPLSPFVPGGFLPTDLIGLSRFSSRPADQETQIQLFLAGLRVLYDQTTRDGQHLILRDHSHGHFNFSDTVQERPSLREIVSRAFPVKSLISVRHPFDSYLSLQDTGWVQHFTPPTLDEYAKRYHAFLDTYRHCERIRYEDFVADPEAIMQKICNALVLGYSPDFPDTFYAIELSGDSGRRGDVIGPRPRRTHPQTLEQEARDSESFMNLLTRLDYSLD